MTLAAAMLGFGGWAGMSLTSSPDAAPAPPSATLTVPTLPDSAPSAGSPPATAPPPTTPPSTSSPSPTAPATSAPAPPAPPPPAQGSPGVPAAVAAAEAQVVVLVNQERAAVGCPALTVDSRLTAAARGHSADMAARGYFSHDTPEGVSFATRITNAGYRWSAAAENIAAGQRDAAGVMRDWMNSDGHRRNILNCSLRQIGVGLAYSANSRPYWTQDFASPR